MKVTVRALLFNENDTDEAPVKIVIWYNGKRIVHSLGIKVKPTQWNVADSYVKKTHANHITFNRIIQNKITEIREYVDKLRSERQEVTLHKIKVLLRGESADDDVFKYAESLLENARSKYTKNTIATKGVSVETLRKFQYPLYFSQINNQWLRNYETFLRTKKSSRTKKPLGNNTVYMNWKFLKGLLSAAYRDKLIKDNPFDNYKASPKYNQPEVTWHPIEVSEKLEEILNTPISDNQRMIVNYYLLSVYSGLRLSDLYRYNKGFVRGNVLLCRAKKNGQWATVPIHKRLQAVIDRIGDDKLEVSEFTFRDNLTTIGKLIGVTRLNPHSGRHSFAVRSLELGIDPDVVADSMGISLGVFLNTYSKITDRKRKSQFSKWDSEASNTALSATSS